jgi:hypothetical protein
MVFTSHRVVSDIFELENIVQQTGMLHGKNLLIDVLRDVFRQDREYKYVSDVFGFPKTPSHLGLDPDAGLDDTETTRIFIGSTYRYDVKFNPSIIVKNTGSRYVPISFNQNLLNYIYRKELLIDGYGNTTTIRTPYAKTIVGAWDQTFEVKVIAESEVDREEIADIVQVTLMGSRRLELQRAGLFIRSMSTSGETEEPYANDFIYMVSINLDVRSEWKIHIPISDFCERISLYMGLDREEPAVDDTPATQISVNEQITLLDDAI